MRVIRNTVVWSLLIAALLLAGCSAQTAESGELLNSAHAITEELLTGMKEADYAKFSRHFDARMRDSMTEAQFRTTSGNIQNKIGQYIAKEYTGSEQQQGYKVLLYRGKFTKADPVVIRMVFSEENGKLLVAGFWLDAPALHR